MQTDPDVVAAYSQDRAVFEESGTAAILVVPRSTDEVVAAVEAANAADVPIVPRGAGTGLTGAANASDGCVVLSLHRMNEILEIDTTNRTCRVQPGVINSDLKRAVTEHGLFYPPDPASVFVTAGLVVITAVSVQLVVLRATVGRIWSVALAGDLAAPTGVAPESN